MLALITGMSTWEGSLFSPGVAVAVLVFPPTVTTYHLPCNERSAKRSHKIYCTLNLPPFIPGRPSKGLIFEFLLGSSGCSLVARTHACPYHRLCRCERRACGADERHAKRGGIFYQRRGVGSEVLVMRGTKETKIGRRYLFPSRLGSHVRW